MGNVILKYKLYCADCRVISDIRNSCYENIRITLRINAIFITILYFEMFSYWSSCITSRIVYYL